VNYSDSLEQPARRFAAGGFSSYATMLLSAFLERRRVKASSTLGIPWMLFRKSSLQLMNLPPGS
jgi:hypothetical protein